MIQVVIGRRLNDDNKAVTTVVANNGRVLSCNTKKISFLSARKFARRYEVYNINSDLTNGTRRNPHGSETIFEGEYSYDSFGNCTENEIFEMFVKRDGKRKRMKDRIFSIAYFY